MRSLRTLMKKAHLFRCARITRSNVLPEYACARGFIARLASGIFLIRLQERLIRAILGEMIFRLVRCTHVERLRCCSGD